MQYLMNLSDQSGQHMAVLTLREFDLKHTAADVVLDVIGAEDPAELVSANILAAGHVDDFKALQNLIFDHDEQGQFIREDVSFQANGRPLDPDTPVIQCFVQTERNGTKYMHCDLMAFSSTAATAGAPNSGEFGTATAATIGAQSNATHVSSSAGSVSEQVRAFARVMFLHQIAIGYQIDVTKDLPELTESIAEAEKNNWIQIDVKKAAYVLTPEGKRVHDSFIAEAQDLIKRFDIYGDVDVDSDGTIRFDSGLGKDWRIPVFEVEGVDPFRARFLIGINDGEWDQLSNWFELYQSESWYQNLFAAIETAPSVSDLGGTDRVCKVIDAGKAELRQDSQFN